MVCPPPKTVDLEELFRHEVFKMLKAEGKITDSVIENMLSWHHSGFNVNCGNAVWPHNEEGLENLARYIIRASFSQERMIYIPANDSPDGAKVIYEAKDGKTSKTFDALEGLLYVNTFQFALQNVSAHPREKGFIDLTIEQMYARTEEGTWFPAAFASLYHFGREIIKDI